LAVSSLPALAQKPGTLPSASLDFPDPSTEFLIQRLTDPAYTSVLPLPSSRAVSRKGNFLVYSTDAAGSMQAYRMESKSGTSRQLTDAEDLDPQSVTLAGDERSVACLAGGRLLQVNVGSSKARQVYRVPPGFSPGKGLGVSEDGLIATLVERQGQKHRLRLIQMKDGSATTLAESDEEMRDPMPRPRRASVLYRRGNDLWLANHDAQQNYRLRLSDGETGPVMWSPDGRTMLYLNHPADAHRLRNIREFTPDASQDAAVADTTQYVAFDRNADATVFVGASGAKATPYVFLLVRAVKREITICEHGSSDPAGVSPTFSPNSQRVLFSSDRHGKPAIYSVQVDKLVEPTDSTQ
jgi:oligogalacturonide lyase